MFIHQQFYHSFNELKSQYGFLGLVLLISQRTFMSVAHFVMQSFIETVSYVQSLMIKTDFSFVHLTEIIQSASELNLKIIC